MKPAVLLSLLLAAGGAARAADHLDGPVVQNTIDASVDLTDLYAWMSPDQKHVYLVLNVFPKATTTARFSNQVQYAFHVTSWTAYGGTASAPYELICTFNKQQVVSCWAGHDDYVTGDASSTAGITSASGRLKVFTGPRDDPFFFNLAGFKAAATALHNALTSSPGTLAIDASGCPHNAPYVSLQATLKGDPSASPPGAPKDSFAGLNVLSIVLSVDAALLTRGGPIVSVWASTHRAIGN